MKAKLTFWVLTALNLLDSWLTHLILLAGGSEANPLINFFIDVFGPIGILYAKVPWLILLGYLVYFRWEKLRPTFQPVVMGLMYGVTLLYALVNIYSCINLISMT